MFGEAIVSFFFFSYFQELIFKWDFFYGFFHMLSFCCLKKFELYDIF